MTAPSRHDGVEGFGIDPTQLERFFALLFRYADGNLYISLRAFPEKQDGPPLIEAHKVEELRGEGQHRLVAFAERCARLQHSCCSPIATFKHHRSAAETDLAQGLTLTVESDTNPEAAREKLEELLGPATVVMASGGDWTDSATGVVQQRLHLHWRLQGPTTDADAHARLKRARTLAAKLVGADRAGAPTVHPMRWPGTLHQKAQPKLASIIAASDESEIDLELALAKLEEATKQGDLTDDSPGSGGTLLDFPTATSTVSFRDGGAQRVRAYAEAARDREVARVAAADEGGRNSNLNEAAFCLGQLVGAGVLDRGIVECSLLEAGTTCGLGEAEVRRTIASGLETGIKAPRDLSNISTACSKVVGAVKGRDTVSANGTKGAGGIGPSTSVTGFKPLDLSVLRTYRRPAPTFPTCLLGDGWSEFVARAAQASGAPVDYVASTLLVSAGALIGNARWVLPWDGWTEPPVVWLALVGTPSAGKTPAKRQLITILQETEEDLSRDHPEKLREWATKAQAAKVELERWEQAVEKAVKANQPPPVKPEAAEVPEKPEQPRLMISDATVEAVARLLAAHPRGLLLHRDELAGWLGSMNKYGGQGDRAFWLEAWSGDRYVVDRVKLGSDPITVLFNAVSVLGTIQPDRLVETLFADADDGLSARFLWCWPEPVPPRRPTASTLEIFAMEAL